MQACLEQLSSKAADGFLLHPAVFQTATTLYSTESSGISKGGMPVSVDCMAMPTTATAAATGIWDGSSSSAALTGALGVSLVASLQGVWYQEPRAVHPALWAAGAQAVDLSDLVYAVDWQVADAFAGSGTVRPQQTLRSRSSAGGSTRRLAALQLCQAASVAAADSVQVLHSHRTIQLKTVVLHSAGSLPAVLQPVAASAHAAVGAAAIAGVLKNLPYEMPFITSQLLDAECTAAGVGIGAEAYSLSAAPLPASLGGGGDLYGLATRGGGALCRPLLSYDEGQMPGGATASVAAAPVDSSSAYVITGGLGGLGLLTARWLAGSGAGSLVLLSRSGLAASASDSASIVRSTALLAIAKCDVSSSEDARLLAELARSHSGRFCGVVHTAGLQVGGGARYHLLLWAGTCAFQACLI